MEQVAIGIGHRGRIYTVSVSIDVIMIFLAYDQKRLEWFRSKAPPVTPAPSFAARDPMPIIASLLGFALVSLGMVLTPGPNMIYIISRSICQGRKAGLISLGGVALGFVFYTLCAAFGITAIVLAVPYAYDALHFCGALYLLYLAWQAIKSGGRSPFQVPNLPIDGTRRLFLMGFVTSLLNPKLAVMYFSLLPQFISLEHGSVLGQALMLGATQIAISVTVNAMIALSAGSIAVFLATRPAWAVAQRWVMATVLGGLAVRVATEPRR